VVLTARQLTRAGLFDGIDLEVAAGECLGLYGFVGAGHQELAHALAGTLACDSGSLRLDDGPLRPGRVARAVARGVVLVAGDRSKTLVRGSEIYKNTTLAHLRRGVGSWLTRRREVAVVDPLLRQVRCRPANPDLKAGLLSGGNQQKVVLAKWLLGPVRVLVLEEPTRGMDVGAKEEVLRLVADLKRQGAAVILASTEPELVLAHADRILVLHRGRISAHFAGTTLDKTTLMNHA
jgi:ribose transport system ATP-binding protein